MQYTITKSTVFPLVEITLAKGEEVRIERGAMVYHRGGVNLEGKLNSNGAGGLGGMMKALGRSMVSSESMFMTTATGLADDAIVAIAPGAPGTVRELSIGTEHWRINDGAFLACDAQVQYEMKRQSVGKAFLGGTGGLFVMETTGTGTMLVTAYGDIVELPVSESAPLVVDNTHVVAWTNGLDYQIKFASGTFGFTSGEGLVNEFRGNGTVLIQTRNVQSLASMLAPYLPGKSS